MASRYPGKCENDVNIRIPVMYSLISAISNQVQDLQAYDHKVTKRRKKVPSKYGKSFPLHYE